LYVSIVEETLKKMVNRYYITCLLLLLNSCTPSEEQLLELKKSWNKTSEILETKLKSSYLYESSNIKKLNPENKFSVDIFLNEKSIYNSIDTKTLIKDITNLYHSITDTLKGSEYKQICNAQIQFWIKYSNGMKIIYTYHSITNDGIDEYATITKVIKKDIYRNELRNNFSVIFDIPHLYKMQNKKQIIKKYGKPTNQFIATKAQRNLGALNTIEFFKDSTGIQIDYAESLIMKVITIKSIWLYDNRRWLNKKDYLKISNLKFINDYNIRVQTDNKDNSVLLGIEIKPISEYDKSIKAEQNNVYTDTYGLSNNQYNTIMELINEGYLQINPELNRAEIDLSLWNNLTYTVKENTSSALATYCGTKKSSGLYWVNIYDLYSGKKLAKYSQSWGFKVY